jgi:hypothetical protein
LQKPFVCLNKCRILKSVIAVPAFAASTGEQPKEATMENAVAWETDLDKSLARARAEKKPVLIDFFNPG